MAENNNKHTWWLVGVTGALVLVSICSTWLIKGSYNDQLTEMRKFTDISKKAFDDQLREMQKSTELSWRPLLDIRFDSSNYQIYFRLGESEEADSLVSDITEISLKSREYLAVKTIGYHYSKNIICRNVGATPLRITREIISALSQKEWEDDYGKSAENFVRATKTFEEPKPLATDIVILQQDSILFNKGRSIARRMPKDLFEKYLKNDSSVILYPYVYMEYEDMFDHKYNALYMASAKISLKVENGFIKKPSAIVPTLEKCRWDVALGED